MHLALQNAETINRLVERAEFFLKIFRVNRVVVRTRLGLPELDVPRGATHAF